MALVLRCSGKAGDWEAAHQKVRFQFLDAVELSVEMVRTEPLLVLYNAYDAYCARHNITPPPGVVHALGWSRKESWSLLKSKRNSPALEGMVDRVVHLKVFHVARWDNMEDFYYTGR